MYSPRSILSSKWRSTGLVRPRGEALPGARERWSSGGEIWPLSGAQKVTKALLTHSATMAVRCAGLRDCCVGETGSSGSSCPNISDIGQDEALSDRALSPCSGTFLCVSALGSGQPRMCPVHRRFAARQGALCWQDFPVFPRTVLSRVRAEPMVPDRAVLRRARRCPLEPVIRRFRA